MDEVEVMADMANEANGELPLVTFALFAYNQEKYIREAVEGALAQNYSNLEIIISDDCSTDGTWAVIEELATRYTGPHQIVLNRNKKNLGIGLHVSLVGTLAKGELIVLAAGDDISLPSRTANLVESWLQAGKPISALHSMARVIDMGGTPIGRFVRGRAAVPAEATLDAFLRAGFTARMQGATAAYTPDQFKLFGPLTGNIEDIPLTFRTLLLGSLIFIEKPLVDYRVSGSNISRRLVRSDRPHVGRWLRACIDNLRCLRSDYEIYCRITNQEKCEAIVKKLDQLDRRFVSSLGMASPSLISNIKGLLAFPVSGGFRGRLWFVATYLELKR